MTTYLPRDATADRAPRPLVTTYLATTEKAEAFGKIVQLEAERRGLRRAETVLVLGDGANWIDPLTCRERLCDQRIVDLYHAAEHLYEAARAAMGKDSPRATTLAEQLRAWLWDGQLERVIATLAEHATRLSPRPARRAGWTRASPADAGQRRGLLPETPKPRGLSHVPPPGLANRLGRDRVRREAANKRVKGTDQFWNRPGVEAILALRALRLSQDDHWTSCWTTRPAHQQAA